MPVMPLNGQELLSPPKGWDGGHSPIPGPFVVEMCPLNSDSEVTALAPGVSQEGRSLPV